LPCGKREEEEGEEEGVCWCSVVKRAVWKQRSFYSSTARRKQNNEVKNVHTVDNDTGLCARTFMNTEISITHNVLIEH
jgi:hypothetical protein